MLTQPAWLSDLPVRRVAAQAEEMPPMTHLCEAFVARARAAPDAVFAVLTGRRGDSVLTNAAVLARAAAIGRDLVAHGARPGDLVAIVLEHGPDLYSAFLGCLLRGLVPSFLPPLTIKQHGDIFRRSMQALFARTAPVAVLSSGASAAHVPDGAHVLRLVEAIAVQPGDESAEAAAARLPGDAQATAFLQHSSGTTGLKKGVMLSHRAVLDQIRLYADALGAAPGDVVASWLPLYHDMGLITSFLLPAVLGCPIVSLDALEWVARPTLLLDAMERWRANVVFLPDFAFHHLLRAASGPRHWDLSATRAVVNCSEPCRATTFARFAEHFGPMGLGADKLRVCYAMAETVFAVTQTPPGEPVRSGGSEATRGFLSCGRPLPGVAVSIRDPHGAEVPEGGLGEIWLRSPTLFGGYFRDPAAIAGRLQDGWFATRDLGCRERGELFVVGRVDDLLIVNGRNVFAHEIEALLNDIPGLAPGRVLAGTDYAAGAGATALVVLAETADTTADAAAGRAALEAQIRRAVLAHVGLSPAAVWLLPRGFLVKSSSGKLARAESWRKFRAEPP